MYCKDYLPVIRRDDLCTLQIYLVAEIKSVGQSCFQLVFVDFQVKPIPI